MSLANAASLYEEIIQASADTKITFLHTSGGQDEWYYTSTLPAPVVCDHVAYTAHDSTRVIDTELAEPRGQWARGQNRTCVFHISLPIENEAPEITKLAWKRRGSPHNPLVLVNRYKAGLLLIALVKERIIQAYTGQEDPTILYVDGDTMFTNNRSSIGTLMERVKRATRYPTTEQRVCGRRDTFSCTGVPAFKKAASRVSLIMTVSNNCRYGYYSHSGAFLFRASAVSALLMDILAASPYYDINTANFKMGDQAIWDWMLKNLFGMDWRRLQALCSPQAAALTRVACHYPEALFIRRFNRRSRRLPPGLKNATTVRGLGNDLLAAMLEKWKPLIQPLEPDSIMLVCTRWFNSPGCPKAMLSDHLHAFHCGDFLWHLFGCKKSAWKEPLLQSTMRSQSCTGLITI